MLERFLVVPSAFVAILGFGAAWLTLRFVPRPRLRWTLAAPLFAASTFAALIFALALHGIWFPRAEYNVRSPSGRYAISATVGTKACKSCIRLSLDDSAGRPLGFYDTNASDVMTWTAGWMPDADIVVLYSADAGSSAYGISPAGQLVLLPGTPEIQHRGEQLKKLRFPRASAS